MAQPLRVHVVQVAYGDAEPVSERIARVAELVRAQRGADLVVLPELWAPTGFGYRDWVEWAETLEGPTMAAISAAARDLGAVVHAGSIIERLPDGAPASEAGPTGRGRWNTSVLFGPDGALVARYRKIHRFGFGEGEPAVLEAGDRVVAVAMPGRADVTLGLATCYDLRFPELFRRLVDAGAQLVLLPAAWPQARVEAWQLLGRARAIENQLVMVQCNTGGSHRGYQMGGHSQVVDATGVVLAEAGEGEQVLVVDVDLDAAARWRERFPVLADRRL